MIVILMFVNWADAYDYDFIDDNDYNYYYKNDNP